MNIRIDIQVERRPIDRLIARLRNPREHTSEQVTQIAASMDKFGWTNPILLGRDDQIIAGHARLLAARQRGMTEVPVIVLSHLSEDQCRALVIADNQLAITGASWNEEMLKLELKALQEENFDIGLVGFDDEELAHLLSEEPPAQGLTDEDAAPTVSERPVTALGELWNLAEHKLYVGDATVLADIDRLMAGDRADLVFTDPPYNVGYEGDTEKRLTMAGDCLALPEFCRFLIVIFENYRRIIKSNASLYLCHPSRWQREFQNALEAAGFKVRCQIIYAKNTFVLSFSRYKYQHEVIFYAHLADQSDAWYGDKSQSTLWQENKPAANRQHPTMKPVALIERALVNSSKAGDLVVDLFAGSGSTLIACERRGRKARLMELDPRYADVICRRYQEFTGKMAVLESDGRTFDQIAHERHKETA